MSGTVPFTAYNLVLGAVTGVGLLYYLRHVPTVVAYRRTPRLAVAGSLLFLIGGPTAELVVHPLVHWVHAGASLLLVAGLYDLVRTRSRGGSWPDTVLRDPDAARRSADWMRPIDETLLRLFDDSDLVLTPAVIAFNSEYSRAEVNRRLGKLESQGYLLKVERGKYRLSDRGKAHLRGPLLRSTIGDVRPSCT